MANPFTFHTIADRTPADPNSAVDYNYVKENTDFLKYENDNKDLGSLVDVDLSTPPEDMNVLAYDSLSGKWIPATGGGGGGGGGGVVIEEIGTIKAWAATTPPAGWLSCNGITIARDAGDTIYPDGSGSGAPDFYGAEYETLFNILTEAASRWENPAGTAVWGTHKIKIPNLQDAFLRGDESLGSSIFSDSTIRGEGIGKKQDDSFESHFHAVVSEAPKTEGGMFGDGMGSIAPWPVIPSVAVTEPTADTVSGYPLRTGAETRPKNVGVNYIIKYAVMNFESIVTKSKTLSADYTILDTDLENVFYFNTGASDLICTLPVSANNLDREITVIKKDAGAGTITLQGDGSELINGMSAIKIFIQNAGYRVKMDGAGAIIIIPIGDMIRDGIVFPSIFGFLSTSNQSFIRLPKAMNISKVIISSTVPQISVPLIVDVHYHASNWLGMPTIFSTSANRPTIAIGEYNAESGTPDVTMLAAGGLIQFTIAQIDPAIEERYLMVSLVSV